MQTPIGRATRPQTPQTQIEPQSAALMPAASGFLDVKFVMNSMLRPSHPCTATVVRSTVSAMIAMLVISRQLTKKKRLMNSRVRPDRLLPERVSSLRSAFEETVDITRTPHGTDGG